MAEGGSEDKNSPSYTNYLSNQNDTNETESANAEIEEPNISSRPDLCNENTLNAERKSSGENLTNQNDPPKREENPFSFKHFLNRDASSNCNTNYQQTGARPKIFSTHRQHSLPPVSNVCNTEPLRMASVDNVRSEFPSVLPDFVQDHLVVEQCYLGNDQNPVDIDNLPDFTINRPIDNSNEWQTNHSNNDSSSDLTFNLTNRRRGRVVDFPLDLPLNADDSGSVSSSVTGSRSCPQSGEVGVSKSLPDFLSDGPIHSNRISNIVNEPPIIESISQRSVSDADTLTENELLREQLQILRQELLEKNLRIQNLEIDISVIQRKEKSYIDALAKSMEQVEGNINSSTKRVVTAENTVSKLRQEIKNLRGEVSHLRKENSVLREHNLGAVGGGCSSRDVPSTSNDISSRRLAQELRGAANSAEHSLRNLLTGLSNLRVIADSVENMYRVEERHEYVLSDFEDESGPAL